MVAGSEPGSSQSVESLLRRASGRAGLADLEISQYKQFTNLFSLFIRWNERINLSAIRNADGIVSRHFVESVACAQALPAGIGTLLDFGSGAGFPGIPVAICRPEILVTLAESQGKKAAFLQEAIRVTGISARVHLGRAETLNGDFDCVTLRAVDRMEKAVSAASSLVATGGWLAIMASGPGLGLLHLAAGQAFSWSEPVQLPGSDQRVLSLGQASARPF
jgi:16S rRNA (guanine527-N7)-methyltransferase